MNTVVLLFLLLLLIFAYCVRRKEEGTCIGDSVIGFDCYASLFASGVSQRFLQYKAPATFDSGIELLAFLSFSLVLLLVLYKKESSSSRLVMQQWELICFLLLLCYSANVLYRFQLARAQPPAAAVGKAATAAGSEPRAATAAAGRRVSGRIVTDGDGSRTVADSGSRDGRLPQTARLPVPNRSSAADADRPQTQRQSRHGPGRPSGLSQMRRQQSRRSIGERILIIQ